MNDTKEKSLGKYFVKLLQKKYMYLLITVFWLGVIFSFSLQPGEDSGDTSLSFGKLLVELLAPGLSEELADLSQAKVEYLHHILRKCAHFTEYLVLGVLTTITYGAFLNGKPQLLKAISQSKKHVTYSADGLVLSAFIEILIAWSLCFLAACTDETIQRFVPGRAGKFSDVMLDCSGALAGILLVCIPVSLKQKRSRANGNEFE